MAQTTTSVGMRQGKEGTQKLHAPCLPPQRRGFPLTGWRSLDTAPFEQTVAGPRRKRPRAQSMDHPLPPIRWRPRGGLNTTPSAPQCHQSRSLADNLCSPGLQQGCAYGLGAKSCSSAASSPTDLSFTACLIVTALRFPPEELPQPLGDKRLLLLFLHASALGSRVRAGTAAYPLTLRGHHRTDF